MTDPALAAPGVGALGPLAAHLAGTVAGARRQTIELEDLWRSAGPGVRRRS